MTEQELVEMEKDYAYDNGDDMMAPEDACRWAAMIPALIAEIRRLNEEGRKWSCYECSGRFPDHTELCVWNKAP